MKIVLGPDSIMFVIFFKFHNELDDVKAYRVIQKLNSDDFSLLI